MSNSEDSEIRDAALRFLREAADPLQRLSAPSAERDVWDTLEEMMFPSAWMAEDADGAGLSAVETGQIVEAAGRHAYDHGLVDTILARHWAGRAGLDIDAGLPLAIAPVRLGDRVALDGDTLSGTLRDVTGELGTALVLADAPDGPAISLADLSAAEVLSQRKGPRGMVSTIRIDRLAASGHAAAPASALTIRATGAALSAGWIAGALRGLLEHCVDYANERVAFGRKIAKFQAIQHNLARLATETASAEVAARTALIAIDAGGGVFESAAAKVRADTAGREGCAIAHQLFGAIGFTIEHRCTFSPARSGRFAMSTGPAPNGPR